MFNISDLTGRWRSKGYDWVLEFNQSHYKLYDATGPLYILKEQGDFKAFHTSYDRIQWHQDLTFSLHQKEDITCYHFQPALDQQDDICIINPGRDDDPELNFDVFCKMFAQHYAFFTLRGINWSQTCAKYRNHISSETSPEELLEVFRGMLLPLNDGHVSLTSEVGRISITGHHEIRQSIKETFGMPTHFISKKSTVDAISSKLKDITLSPFSHSIKNLNTACNGIMTWCELKPGVGYLNILRLFGFAGTNEAKYADDLPHDRQDVGPFLEKDLLALNAALDKILEDFKSVETVILDIRINGGGFDRAAMTIANRFADAKHLAFRKKARNGDSYTPYQDFFVAPEGQSQFTKPVYMMTSPLCLSAGEIFTFCMNALPHVTSVGEKTMGMLSDNLNKHLPNGWELSLSNEIYEAPDGSIYEAAGIPPDIEIKTLDTVNCAKTLQQTLETTVQRASSHIP